MKKWRRLLNKETYALIARVISGEILLPKKDQCYNCKCE